MLTSDAKPTIASRWTDRLGERVGSLLPSGGNIGTKGGAETEVQSCIAVCEKHVITALWDTRSWSEQRVLWSLDNSANLHALTKGP